MKPKFVHTALAVTVVTVKLRPWRYLLVLTADKDLQLTTRLVSCHGVVFNSVEHFGNITT